MRPRSTRHGPAKSTGRVRRAADVRTIGSFRGALEPGFTERIRNHWRFSGAGIFKPIRLNFRKPENSFALALGLSPRRTKPARYVFSPTIQLTFPFAPINNVFFENHSDVRFQWLLSGSNAPGGTRAASSLGGEVWDGMRLLRDYREGLVPVQGRPALMLLHAGRLAGGSQSRVGVPGSTPRVETSGGTPAPFLFTILHTTRRRQTPTLKEGPIHSRARTAGHVRPPRGGRTTKAERMLVLLRSIFSPGGAAWGRPSAHNSSETDGTVKEVALRRAFFTQLTLAESRPRLAAAAGGAFANPSLTFAGSKPSDATRRSQSFGQPVVLSHAKRGTPQLQEVVNALHNLRSSQSEMKPPSAPQLPSIEQLTSQVRQQLERDLRIEKERRGL